MVQPNGHRSIWLRVPELFGELQRCLVDHWSAGRTAEHLTEIAHEPVTRNAVIGASNRRGLHFGSDEVGQRPNPRNGTKQIHHKKRHLAAVHMPEKPKPAKQQHGPFLGLTLLELEKHHCRWPEGGEGNGPILFCGQPKADGSPYCLHHHSLVYYRPRFYASSGQSI